MKNGETLPTDATGARERTGGPRTFCFKLFVQHDMREAGGSRWAPWVALCATRLLCSFSCIAVLVVLALGFSGAFNFLYCAGPGLAGLTYLLLAVCTCMQGMGMRASRKLGFSTAVVLLHFITAALSLFLVAEFVALVIITQSVIGFNPNLLIILTPFFAFLLDVLVMQARIRFRYRYCLFFFVLAVLYTIIAIVVRAVTCSSCMRAAVIGRDVGMNLGIGLVASLVAVILTRIPWPCFRN